VKPNPFAHLFAVLGFAALVGILLFSRDNKLANRPAAASAPAPSQETLYPSIQSLAAAPAPEAKPEAKPDAKPEAKP
jgi:hypothetical protein